MTFKQLLEIVRKEEADYPAGELAITLTSFIRDICNEAEPFIAEHEVTANGEDITFLYEDFGSEFGSRFMKPRQIRIDNEQVRTIANSVHGDIVYETIHNGINIGINNAGDIRPLGQGKTFTLEYFSYPPPVSVNTGMLPIPQAHSMYLWRIKGDLYAERRHWDRAGYYNRRYERALVQYKRMVNSSGIQKIIHPNATL